MSDEYKGTQRGLVDEELVWKKQMKKLIRILVKVGVKRGREKKEETRKVPKIERFLEVSDYKIEEYENGNVKNL